MSNENTSTEDTKTPEQVLERIRATWESSEAQRITEKPRDGSSHDKTAWLDKWLPMKITHPQVAAMRNEAYDFCMAYAKRPERGYRLVIYGENGSGKSRIAKKVCNWADACKSKLPYVECGPDYSLEGRRKPQVTFHHFPTLIRDMTQDFKRDSIGELSNRPDAPNLLILDDVGAEHDPSKYGAAQLYLILERRSDMWTLLTTNAAPEAWEHKWDRRVSSRLLRNSRQVCVDKVPDFSSL